MSGPYKSRANKKLRAVEKTLGENSLFNIAMVTKTKFPTSF